MACELTLEQARALVGNDALWPRVRDFLWRFADQVDATWLEGLRAAAHLPPSAAAAAWTSPRARAWALGELGVAPCFHDFPATDGSRLLLLDAATLDAVARWLGALAHVDFLRRTADGATVRAFKAALPGVYPDVLSYAAYFTSAGRNADLVEALSPDDVVAAGYGRLFSLFAALPAPLVARAVFKFPKSRSGLCAPHGEAPPLAVVHKLLKLRFPEAYRTCCL